jgi:hypothetical protein
MSHSYFISSKEETDLHLDSQQFVDSVMRTWPGGTYHFIKDERSPYSVRWTIQMGHGELTGALDREGQSIAVQADVRDAAEFARWFRGQVPRQYELAFYGESGDMVDLTETTTVDELVRPFVASH